MAIKIGSIEVDKALVNDSNLCYYIASMATRPKPFTREKFVTT